MKEINLHIGCGKVDIPGFTNIDLEEYDHIDYVQDGTDLFNFERDSVDLIYASHVLDHLSRKNELDKALINWYRILKPGGTLRVAVSDFEMVAKLYLKGFDLEKLWGFIVGGHKTEYDKHGCIFDYKVLKRYLEEHGFKNIRKYNWKRTIHANYWDYSRSYIPKGEDKKGILMSLNVEANK
jgi:predicted SAM-dependent methyltransferase